MMQADVWFEPSLVLEILGAEITLSPIHPCAMDSIEKEQDWRFVFHVSQANTELTKALKTQLPQKRLWRCIGDN